MKKEMTLLLPQADKLEKIIKTCLFICVSDTYTKEELAEYLMFKNLQTRQSSYYISACYYLGLVDEFGGRNALTKEICNDPSSAQEVVYKAVFSDKYCSKILANMLVGGQTNNLQFTIDMLTQDFADQYSNDTIHRRAQTLLAWCNEVYGFVKENFR